MNKRQQEKFNKLLATFAKINDTTVEEYKDEVDYNSLVSMEDSFYEGQAVYNFYKARIEPRLENKETPADFDKRYREWRIKVCEECQEEFAYAFHYEGVKFCSLFCLDRALSKIGMKVTRGRDLKKRWGVFFHPAIVPASAFEALKSAYGDIASESFDPSLRVLPKHLSHYSPDHDSDTELKQDSLDT